MAKAGWPSKGTGLHPRPTFPSGFLSCPWVGSGFSAAFSVLLENLGAQGPGDHMEGECLVVLALTARGMGAWALRLPSRTPNPRLAKLSM